MFCEVQFSKQSSLSETVHHSETKQATYTFDVLMEYSLTQYKLTLTRAGLPACFIYLYKIIQKTKIVEQAPHPLLNQAQSQKMWKINIPK